MMKRVSLYRIKTSIVGHRGSRRSERLNANGDVCLSEDDCEREQLDENKQTSTSHSCIKDRITVEKSKISRNNILRTLRLKWRRRKRGKREGRGRGESHSQNSHSDVDHAFVSKQSRSKPSKCNTRGVICPLPSPVRCVRRESSGVEESPDHILCNSTKILNSVKNTSSSAVSTEELRECSCFGSPSKRCSSSKESQVHNDIAGNKCIQQSVGKPLQDECALPTVMFTSSLESDRCDLNVADLVTTSKNSCKENDTSFLCSPKMTMDPFTNLLPSPTCESNNSVSIISNSYTDVPRVGSLTQELYKLSKCGWYWGPITRGEAEEKLTEQPDGAFLVRDSSDDRYLLSLSFRSYGKTLHTRIEHCNGLFSFYSQHEPEGHTSIVELIEQSMNYSQSGVFCYSRSRLPGSPSFPVRLTKPVSRFTQVRSLQYLCRFVIRQYTRFDHIQKLPLPARIRGYLEEGHY